jgi:hypothetical protein
MYSITVIKLHYIFITTNFLPKWELFNRKQETEVSIPNICNRSNLY